MKLSYSDLISPFPFKTSICSIKSPTLSEVWNITYETYLFYIRILSLTPQMYIDEINPKLRIWYESLSEADKNIVTLIDICIVDETIINNLTKVLDFFIVENIIWNKEISAFIIYDSKDDKGNIIPKSFIHTKIWKELVSIILQLNAINNDEQEIDESKVKSKKALEILEKLKKGREANKKKNKSDKALQLDNLVSVIANKHASLNMTNIWNITVYQLWDAFTRMAGNNIYDMSKFTVSVWGDEKKQFNYTEWYKRIDN
nr:MAG TPA: hypothetical protein [Caudoviricetes sp.]